MPLTPPPPNQDLTLELATHEEARSIPERPLSAQGRSRMRVCGKRGCNWAHRLTDKNAYCIHSFSQNLRKGICINYLQNQPRETTST